MFLGLVRQYLSLLVPLIALLIGVESILLTNRVLQNYEEVAGKNYAIVVVSESELHLGELSAKIPESFELLELDSSAVLEDIAKHFSEAANLKNSLPFFYSLKLSEFPSQARIQAIESALKSFPQIARVESFSKSHSQTYRLLAFLKGCVWGFSALVFILSVLLMVKQIEVWRFIHSERMEIMSYFGAPSAMKNAPLYRQAFIGSLVASAIVVGGVIYALLHPKVSTIFAIIGVNPFNLALIAKDAAILLAFALVMSFLAVFVVILSQKEP